MAQLFDALRLRGVTMRNRAWMSPMCQHSAENGVPGDWHLVHLGARAVGGAGLIMVESTAVAPEGRISRGDVGLWNDEQVEAWRRITTFIKGQGAVPAVQLSHAGRKGSTGLPWEAARQYVAPDQGGWTTVGPSTRPFGDLPPPDALTAAEVEHLPEMYAEAAARAHAAGFDVVELHAAHGYLLHQFLSPLSNERKDHYGGSLENRARIVVAIVERVRRRLPSSKPLFLRVSATDWVPGGWDLAQTVALTRMLRQHVDLVDVSTGGAVPDAKITARPGYQEGFSRIIRAETPIPTAAVGLYIEPGAADNAIAGGSADAVMIGRAHLNDPYWVRHAADEMGVDPCHVRVKQYARAEPRPADQRYRDESPWLRVPTYDQGVVTSVHALADKTS